MKKQTYLTTYMRVLLNDWQGLADLMQSHASPIVGEVKTESTPESVKERLTEKQIEDALSGPYATFFQQKLAAYAVYARINMAVLAKEDNPLKNAAEKYELSDADEAIKAVQLNKSLLEKLTPANMQKIRKDLDKLVEDHFDNWQTQIEEWYKDICQASKRVKVALSDSEQEQLCADEPISEIKDRYADLNLPWPKLKQNGANFREYIQLKVYLAIQSTLSRQQLPHGVEEVNRKQKLLKSTYKRIAEAEEELTTKQQKETDEVIAPIKQLLQVD